MKSSEILTRAAELVDSDRYVDSILAIHSLRKSGDAVRKFEDALFPMLFEGSNTLRERQNHRVMALLLCAAIAEEMGD